MGRSPHRPAVPVGASTDNLSSLQQLWAVSVISTPPAITQTVRLQKFHCICCFVDSCYPACDAIRKDKQRDEEQGLSFWAGRWHFPVSCLLGFILYLFSFFFLIMHVFILKLTNTSWEENMVLAPVSTRRLQSSFAVEGRAAMRVVCKI